MKTFEEDPEIQILNGRYGVYIAYKKSNYKIPKSVENPADLTIEQVRQLIEEQDKAPTRPARRAAGGSRSKKS